MPTATTIQSTLPFRTDRVYPGDVIRGPVNPKSLGVVVRTAKDMSWVEIRSVDGARVRRYRGPLEMTKVGELKEKR